MAHAYFESKLACLGRLGRSARTNVGSVLDSFIRNRSVSGVPLEALAMNLLLPIRKQQSQRITLLDVVIAIVTLGVGVIVVIGADRDHRRVEPPYPRFESPYRRLQHDYFFAMAIATLGAGALLATDRTAWTRRGLSRPGTIAVVLAISLGLVQILFVFLLRWPLWKSADPIWFDMNNGVEFRLSGSIFGAWVVMISSGLWRRSQNWKEKLGRFLGWGWLGTIGLRLGYLFLFG